ncbi:hypothetical protein GQ457_10G006710 [Hibiscus cannabinus]
MAKHGFLKQIVGNLLLPDSSPFAKLLDFYIESNSLIDLCRLHVRIIKSNFASETFVLVGLIDAYEKCGSLEDSRKLGYVDDDQCSWNSIIYGFAQQDRFNEAFHYFVRKHGKDFVLNEYSFGGALSACSELIDVILDAQIHVLISKTRFFSNIYIGLALVDMYGKCGNASCGQRAFRDMSERNRVSWNNLVTCYEKNGPLSVAL